MYFNLAVLVSITAHAIATSIGRSPYVVKETHYVPKDWSKMGRSHGAKTIQLRIGLKQSNFDELDRHLHEISDPDHKRYGQHLSGDEVDALVAPSSETHNLVHDWLLENGIDVSTLGYSSAKDWIIVHLPIGKVEELLDTEYHNYKHKDGSIVARTTKWALPRHLHDHIDAIQPTTSFFRGAAQDATLLSKEFTVPADYTPPKNPSIAAVCNVSSVAPECFQTLYKTKGYKTQACDKNSVGFANYLGEFPVRPDTALFLKKYRPEAESSAYTFKQYSIDNGPIQDGPLTANQSASYVSTEANLDVQAISGISWKTPIISYSTGGEPPFIRDPTTPTNTNEPYLAWVTWLLSQKHIPDVITTSYSEPEQTVPRSYAERVCKQFAQVTARGTTLFFSSGDSGVGATDLCYTNDGKNTTRFLPHFPTSCPYVTAVGATMNFEPEESAYASGPERSDGSRELYWSTGSGFSDYFPRPKYQDTVVPAYVKALGHKYAGLYNASGRGYPDLAAQGKSFAIFWNGTEYTTSGTSASCPLTGGIFSLVNDALLASGKSTLGWLNPWLYKKGYQGLTDITKGFSYGCNVEGFPVTQGWDPVTGFGTPDFPKLLRLAGANVH